MDEHRIKTLMHDLRNGVGGVHTKLTLALISKSISQELYDDCIQSIEYTLSKLVEVGEAFNADVKPVAWVSIETLLSMLVEETSIANTKITHNINCDNQIASIALVEKDFRSVLEEVIRNGLKYGATGFHIHLSMKEGV